MGRAYHPSRVIKSSGIHTFYIGRQDDPIVEAFESYCIHTEQTFSETCRDMITMALVKLGLLKDPGIADGVLLKPGEGEFTPKYYEFRKEAEKIRTKQLMRLDKEQKQKADKVKEEEKASTTEDLEGVGF